MFHIIDTQPPMVRQPVTGIGNVLNFQPPRIKGQQNLVYVPNTACFLAVDRNRIDILYTEASVLHQVLTRRLRKKMCLALPKRKQPLVVDDFDMCLLKRCSFDVSALYKSGMKIKNRGGSRPGSRRGPRENSPTPTKRCDLFLPLSTP